MLVKDDTLVAGNFAQEWVHICFNAMESSIKECDADDSPMKLFFAEIRYYKYSKPAVTICMIVEGKNGPHKP